MQRNLVYVNPVATTPIKVGPAASPQGDAASDSNRSVRVSLTMAFFGVVFAMF